jgi:hypothetical protein
MNKIEQELINYLNETPRLLSLLYDIDLMPEQTMDSSKYWKKTLVIIEHWKANSEAEENK